MRIRRLRCMMLDGGIIGLRSSDMASPLPLLLYPRLRPYAEDGPLDGKIKARMQEEEEGMEGKEKEEWVRGAGDSGLGGSCGVVGHAWGMG